MIDILYSCPISLDRSFGHVCIKEVEVLSNKYDVRQIPPTGDMLMQDFIASHSNYMDVTRSFHGWSHFSLQSIREANIKNIPSILERTSMHILDQKNILGEHFKTDDYTVKKAIKEYNECSHMIVPSTLVKESMINRKIDESKIHIVRHGVDIDKFKFDRIDHDGFRILYVGMNSYRKNVMTLIKAFKKTQRGELYLVGDGCSVLTDIKNNIYGSKFVSDDILVNKYQSSDLLVLPSLEDGFGLPVLEALSCGTPVLTSNLVGSKDIISDKVGFAIDMNVDTLHYYIEYAMNYRFDNNECRRIAENNTWELNMKKLLSLYSSIIGK